MAKFGPLQLQSEPSLLTSSVHRTLAIRLLATFDGSRLSDPDQAKHFVRIWRDVVIGGGSAWPTSVKHLECATRAKLLRVALSNPQAFDGSDAAPKASEVFQSRETWIEYLTDPWLPPSDFYGAIVIGSEVVKRRDSWTEPLEDVTLSLLRSCTSVSLVSSPALLT